MIRTLLASLLLPVFLLTGCVIADHDHDHDRDRRDHDWHHDHDHDAPPPPPYR